MQPLNNFMCCTLSQEVKQLFFWLLDMLPPSPSLRLKLCLIIWSFVGLFVYTSPSYCMWVQFSWVSFFLAPLKPWQIALECAPPPLTVALPLFLYHSPVWYCPPKRHIYSLSTEASPEQEFPFVGFILRILRIFYCVAPLALCLYYSFR